MSLLQEGKAAIHGRIKLIKLADKSEHGWQTVAEYVTNELAENSDDEKRIDRAERTAEKKAKKKAKSTSAAKARQPFTFSKAPAVTNSLRPSITRPPFPSYNMPLGNQVGPCYKLSIVFELIGGSHSFVVFFTTALFSLSSVQAAINAMCSKQHWLVCVLFD
jgi:hypothetical protein